MISYVKKFICHLRTRLLGLLFNSASINTIISLGLRVGFTILTLITGVLLARWLGTAGYGHYAYAQAWVSLLSVFGNLGVPSLLLREIAISRSQQAWENVPGLLLWSNRSVLLASSGLALCGIFVLWMFSVRFEPMTRNTLSIALLALPLLSLTQLKKATLQGLNKVLLGQLPETLVQPLMFFILIGGLYWVSRPNFNATSVILLFSLSSGIALLIASIILHSNMPSKLKYGTSITLSRKWFYSALPFLLISGMQVISARTDIIMLGILSTPSQVGIYAVATQGSSTILLILIATNAVIAPSIASLYRQGNYEALQKLVTRSVRLMTVITIPIVVLLISLGQPILTIFGTDFKQGYLALLLLSTGQMVNVLTGSVGLLLSMTGYEVRTTIGITIGAMFNIPLNALLIPYWGINGAALATAISIIIQNGLLAIWVVKLLHVNPSILPIPRTK